MRRNVAAGSSGTIIGSNKKRRVNALFNELVNIPFVSSVFDRFKILFILGGKIGGFLQFFLLF